MVQHKGALTNEPCVMPSLEASLKKLMQRASLDEIECAHALSVMLAETANPLQTAAFLVLLRTKTETAIELFSFVQALKSQMVTVPIAHRVLDIVGTGGDGVHTVNISTGSAILAASCGVKLVKHGNRAVTSLAGSADVLEALGVNIHATAKTIAACVDEVGIGFCFAPHFHPPLAQLRALRQQLRVPTTFNILGPLLNPATPAHILLGVFDAELLLPMALALQRLGTVHSMVVHGCGLDELSCIGPANVIEVTPTELRTSVLDPETLGLERCTLHALQGGDAKTNAQLLLDVFAGDNLSKHRAIADTLIFNAGVALYLYSPQLSLEHAIAEVRRHLQQGAALTLLENWRTLSHA